MFLASKFIHLRLLQVKPTNRSTNYRYFFPDPKNQKPKKSGSFQSSSKRKGETPQTVLKEQSDHVIKERKGSDLWKPIAFAGGFSLLCFTGAAVVHYERNKEDNSHQNRRRIERNKKYGQFRQQLNELYNKFTPAQKTVAAIVGLNGLVFLAWRLLPTPIMIRYFTSYYYGERLYSPMILSAFSHIYFLHLLLNMDAFCTFALEAIDNKLGVEQFLALYLSAAVVSNAISFIPKLLSKQSSIPSVGASGAILTLFTYVCCKNGPEELAAVIIVFDLLGLVLRFKLFDHAAHLGGSLFGIWYSLYGEKLIWEHMRPKWVRVWKEKTGR